MLGLVASSAALAVTLAGCGGDDVVEMKLTCDGFKDEAAFAFCYFPEDGKPTAPAQIAGQCEKAESAKLAFLQMVHDADKDAGDNKQSEACCVTCVGDVCECPGAPGDEDEAEKGDSVGVCDRTSSKYICKSKTKKECKFQQRRDWVVKNHAEPCTFTDGQDPVVPDCDQTFANLGTAATKCFGKGSVASEADMFVA